MKNNTQFAVLGLGRFGYSVVETLAKNGYNVLAPDRDIERIDLVSNIATKAAQCDVTDERALREIGIRDYDVVIIAIGENLEASILATIQSKEQGCKFVLVKANNSLEEKILTRIGADRVVLPEKEMGMKVAMSLVAKNVMNFINVSEDYSIAETEMPEEWVNKTIIGAEIRAKTGLNVIAIKKPDGHILVSPSPITTLEKDDILVVLGSNENIIKVNAVEEKHFYDIFKPSKGR